MQRSLVKKIWLFSIVIMIMGLIALYSASYNNVRVSQKVFYDQFMFSFISLVIMYSLGRTDYRKFYDVAYILYIFIFFLLFWVELSGRYALGAQRWIEIGGVSFQPSEFAKFSLILVLARYFANRRPTLSFGLVNRAQILWRDLILPLILSLVLIFFVFKQPDLGTALLLFGVFLLMLFVSGLEYKILLSFVGICFAFLPLFWHLLKPYQRDRLLVFLDPNMDPLGAGYTIIQSKIAIGSGQVFGRGWLSGTQNQLNFLPERHTDFIFSVIGEEWGLIGAVVLLFCYFNLINCGLNIAERVKDKFGMMVAVGITSILTLQVIINIGMVMGLFPVVGITLPFMSYGRSSFLIFAVMMGILLNLSQRRSVF